MEHGTTFQRTSSVVVIIVVPKGKWNEKEIGKVILLYSVMIFFIFFDRNNLTSQYDYVRIEEII